MKTTYLVNKETEDGTVQLSEVSSTEWVSVVRANKGRPAHQKRYFIVDYIPDQGEIDRMVIEVPFDQFHEWHKEHMASKRNRILAKGFQHLSLDVPIAGHEETIFFNECIESEIQSEEDLREQLLLDELKMRLAEWKPWGNELLDLYMRGHKRTCTKYLAEKYGVSEQVIRKYKRQFEKFIKNFLSGVSF